MLIGSFIRTLFQKQVNHTSSHNFLASIDGEHYTCKCVHWVAQESIKLKISDIFYIHRARYRDTSPYTLKIDWFFCSRIGQTKLDWVHTKYGSMDNYQKLIREWKRTALKTISPQDFYRASSYFTKHQRLPQDLENSLLKNEKWALLSLLRAELRAELREEARLKEQEILSCEMQDLDVNI